MKTNIPPSGARVALVTGASRGIGQAIAEALQKRGDIVLTPTRKDLDLSCDDSVLAWLNAGQQDIDILVNNAGENPISPLDQVGLEEWHHAITVNLTAPMLLMQGLGRKMCSRNWGRIVNVSSCYSIVARTGRASYGAAKSGLNSLTRSAALEFASCGVLVNTVLPGFVETDLTNQNNSADQIRELVSKIPLGRLAQPTEVARLVSFLTSSENTYITGHALVIDGGFLIQ